MIFSLPGTIFILSFDGHWICDYFQWVYFVERIFFFIHLMRLDAGISIQPEPTNDVRIIICWKMNEINFFEWSNDLFIIYYLFKRIFSHRIILFIRIRSHVIALSYSRIPYTLYSLPHLFDWIYCIRMQYSQELTSNWWKIDLKCIANQKYSFEISWYSFARKENPQIWRAVCK